MSAENANLARAFRILADIALLVGALTVSLALTLHINHTPAGNVLPLLATAAIAGIIAIAAAIQHRRYRGRP